MISTDIELLIWFYSKCKSLTPYHTILLSLVFCVILNLIFWSHPGGPAWGLYRWTNSRNFKSLMIPGPKGLPILGSLNLMTGGTPHRKISDAAKACKAKRLMAFSIGQTRAIVTCRHQVAKEILNSSNFVDRPFKESAYNMMFNRSIGFAPYGVYWRTLRKIADAHLFCPKQIKASEDQRMEIANQMVAKILNDSNKQNGSNMICVRDVLKLGSLNNMMSSVFGRKYDMNVSVNAADVEELKDLVDQGYELLGQVNWSDHLSFLTELDIQKIRFRCSRMVPRVNQFVGKIIEEHKEKLSDDMNNDFVDVLLSLKGDDRLSDVDIIAVLWEMIFRGTDTVAILIEWILARLVLHPDVQSKVHDELDKVVGNSRCVNESDLTDLVYLTSVVKEVLRLHPPGPLLSWSRLSIRDSMVDGHQVPTGTTAMVNMWAIMRDPEVWVEPLKFEPQRFIGHNSNTEYFSVLGSDLRIAPFGSGRRSCPGKTLGMTTVTFWVAKLLNEFQFVSCGQGVNLSEVLKLSCEMVNPLKVYVRPRHCISGS